MAFSTVSRVLITGGAGFIGSHLALRLATKGTDVIVLDNLSPQIHQDVGWPAKLLECESSSKLELVQANILDRERLLSEVKRCDCIVHLAAETGTAQSMYEIAKCTQTNDLGTALLCEAIAVAGSRINSVILASSRAVYGEGHYHCIKCNREVDSRVIHSQNRFKNKDWEFHCSFCMGRLVPVPTTEHSSTLPTSVYGATKLAQEHLLSILCKSRDIDLYILRLQNVYGKGQSMCNPYTGIVVNWISELLRNNPIDVYEDGKMTRNFVEISSVVDAMIHCINGAAIPNIYNIGGTNSIDLLSMAILLKEICNSTSDIRVTGEYRIGDIRHSLPDLSSWESQRRQAGDDDMRAALAGLAGWVGQNRGLMNSPRLNSAREELREHGMYGVCGG